MKSGWLNIVGLSKQLDVRKCFLVHLVKFGRRRPHICISEYDLANCLTDLGLVKAEVQRLVNAAKTAGGAKSKEIWFSERQVHKYWQYP